MSLVAAPSTRVCYGYARVSTKRQARDGISLDIQQKELMDNYRRNFEPKGFAWGGTFSEDVSGKTPIAERKAGGELVRRLRRGDAVIVTDLTRLSRRFFDMVLTVEQWVDLGIYVTSIKDGVDTSTPTGRMVCRILISIAELHREMISESAREAARWKREQRARSKRPPHHVGNNRMHGFKKVVRNNQEWLEPLPDDLRLMEEFTRKKDAGMPYKKIYMEALNAGWKKYRGKWTNVQLVSDMIRAYRRIIAGQGPQLRIAEVTHDPTGGNTDHVGRSSGTVPENSKPKERQPQEGA